MTGWADCRLCGTPLRQTFVDLGLSPLANSYLACRGARAGRALLPAPRLRVRAVPARPAPDGGYSGGDLQRLRVLLVVLRLVAGACPALRRRRGGAARARSARAGSSRSPRTTATCCSTSWSAGSRCSGSSPRRTSRQPPSSAGFRRASSSSAPRSAAGSPVEQQADLVLGNNVLAHVPDVHDFVEGMRLLLKPEGTITMEFPHLLRLILERQFDTIYHEHYSYFSLLTVERLFARPRPRRSSTSRSCRRTAGHCGSTRATPASASRRNGSSRCARSSARTGCTSSTPISTSRRPRGP